MAPFKLTSEILSHILLYIANIPRGKSYLHALKGVKGIKNLLKEEIECFNIKHYCSGGILEFNENKLNSNNPGMIMLTIFIILFF